MLIMKVQESWKEKKQQQKTIQMPHILTFQRAVMSRCLRHQMMKDGG